MKTLTCFAAVLLLSLTALGQAQKDSSAQKTKAKAAPASSASAARTVVEAKDAPKPIGPYSQAIKAGEFVFCAGQTARDPVTNKLIEGDVSAQTDRVLKNISAVLTAAGTDLDHVVKTTVYLKNMSDFNAMNEVYGKYFKDAPPARATVGVAALPVDALVEIEVVAMLPGK
jgi:2-iminobutanoate/2-iminopropanoate deaminase